MGKYSIHFVVDSGDEDAEASGQIERCLGAMDMVLGSNGLASELVMYTKVNQEWLDNVHAELDAVEED